MPEITEDPSNPVYMRIYVHILIVLSNKIWKWRIQECCEELDPPSLQVPQTSCYVLSQPWWWPRCHWLSQPTLRSWRRLAEGITKGVFRCVSGAWWRVLILPIRTWFMGRLDFKKSQCDPKSLGSLVTLGAGDTPLMERICFSGKKPWIQCWTLHPSKKRNPCYIWMNTKVQFIKD